MFNNLRKDIGEFLGVSNPRTNAAYDVLASQQKETYTQKLISYQGSEEDDIKAFLLLPNGVGPFPAVLVHHQHNGERHLGKSEPAGIVGDHLQAFGPALARKGYIVLAPDSICFEDRRRNRSGTEPDEEGDWLQHYNEMCYRLIRGDFLMKKVLDDAIIAGSILMSIPEIDKGRMGLLGHSYGGQTVLFQGALDERFTYACSSGAVCSFANRMANDTGIEMAAVVPGLLKNLEIVDLLKCFLPRKLLVVSATEDKYSRDADAVCDPITRLYSESGFGDCFVHRRFEGGHGLTLQRHNFILNWLFKNC